MKTNLSKRTHFNNLEILFSLFLTGGSGHPKIPDKIIANIIFCNTRQRIFPK
jgi:hypothetical protein